MSTIKEKKILDYPSEVTFSSTKIILNQMQKNICKIILNDGSKGSGFFCKIPFPYNKTQLLPVLITNNHVINETILNKEEKIKIFYENEFKSIELINRIKYTNNQYDVTIIEIKESIDKIRDFLEIDENKMKNDSTLFYLKESIYIIHYPNDEKLVSYGILQNIFEDKKFNFSHVCCTYQGSSGSPIINLKNNKVIGIHKESNERNNFNIGCFLDYPIQDFISNIKGNKDMKNNFNNLRYLEIKHFSNQYNNDLNKADQNENKKGNQKENISFNDEEKIKKIIFDKENEIKKLKNEIEQLNKRFNNQSNFINNIQKNLDEFKIKNNNYEKKIKELMNQLEIQKKKYEEEKTILISDKEKISKSKKHLEEKINLLEQTKVIIEKEILARDEKIKELDLKIQKKNPEKDNSDIKKLNQLIDERNKIMEQKQKKISELEKKLEDVLFKIKLNEKEINDLKKNLSEKERIIKIREKEINNKTILTSKEKSQAFHNGILDSEKKKILRPSTPNITFNNKEDFVIKTKTRNNKINGLSTTNSKKNYNYIKFGTINEKNKNNKNNSFKAINEETKPNKKIPLMLYEKPTLVGLQKIGKFNFLNATLQCLSQTEDLTNYFLDKNLSAKNNIDINNTNGLQLSPVYLELIKKLWDKNNYKGSFAAKKFLETIEKMNPSIKCSADLTDFILKQFHKELKKTDNSGNDFEVKNEYDKNIAFSSFKKEFEKHTSIISDIFFGIKETTKICLFCKNKNTKEGKPIQKSYSYKSFNRLIFPLEKVITKEKKIEKKNNISVGNNKVVTFDDCFYYNQKTFLYPKEKNVTCNQCKQLSDFHSTSKIFSSPNVLIIDLNRNNNLNVMKFNFTETIDISKFILSKRGKEIFNLYGVISLYGKKSVPYFYAFCKSPIDNKWYRYNDLIVTEVENIQKEVIDFGTPYILFYKKKY